MKTSTKTLLLLAAFVTVSHVAQAKNPRKNIGLYSVSLDAIISGNGFGTQYAPTAGIRFGERVIAFGGPTFCKTDWNNNGYIFGTRYLLLKESETYTRHLTLGVSLSAQRLTHACLSKSAIGREEMTMRRTNPEGTDYASLRYEGWEFTSGFTVAYRCDFGLAFQAGAGISYYDSQQTEHCVKTRTYRANSGMSLRLSAGIGWRF
jgi:hypothetical protein